MIGPRHRRNLIFKCNCPWPMHRGPQPLGIGVTPLAVAPPVGPGNELPLSLTQRIGAGKLVGLGK